LKNKASDGVPVDPMRREIEANFYSDQTKKLSKLFRVGMAADGWHFVR
jgi:hypothetical protein